MLNLHDSSVIVSYKNGIKLLNNKLDRSSREHQHAIDIFNFPFNVYFLDPDSRMLAGNEWVASSHDALSSKDLFGLKVDSVIPCKQEAFKIKQNDRQVLMQESLILIEEEFATQDEMTKTFISVKMPVYDDASCLAGILGLSILTQGCLKTISQYFMALLKAGLLSSQASSILNMPYLPSSPRVKELENEAIILSRRELQVLNLSAKHLTAKEISKKLLISHRTVESHIDKLKHKLNVTSKKELIEKMFYK